MSILVKTFNGDELKDAISKSPKIVIEYIEALRRIYSNERKLTVDCMKKLRNNPLTVERVLAAITSSTKFEAFHLNEHFTKQCTWEIRNFFTDAVKHKGNDLNTLKQWVEQVESEATDEH